VVDGERLEIAVRLRVQKQPMKATGTLSTSYVSISPASDEASEEKKTPKDGLLEFVPETPVVEDGEGRSR